VKPLDIVHPEIEAYVAAHTAAPNALLDRIEFETQREVLMPRMLSGKVQGRFLAMLSHMMQPRYIVEVGTFTGYATLCLAEGLIPEGKLVTIDVNDELESRVRHYFNASPFAQQIEYKIGRGLDVLPTLEDNIDLAFIDADKINMQAYLELIYPKLRVGGVVLADNVLWSGKVVGAWQSQKTDKDTEAIHAFNAQLNEDNRWEHILLTIRDGIMMLRKK
jgi:caffeoyl-CoA O-methyltransferase